MIDFFLIRENFWVDFNCVKIALKNELIENEQNKKRTMLLHKIEDQKIWNAFLAVRETMQVEKNFLRERECCVPQEDILSSNHSTSDFTWKTLRMTGVRWGHQIGP